jgi:hypothetical protein
MSGLNTFVRHFGLPSLLCRIELVVPANADSGDHALADPPAEGARVTSSSSMTSIVRMYVLRCLS